MMLLARMAADLLQLLTIVDMGAGAIILAMAFRERILMASEAPAWRGWFSLRRATAEEYSSAYRTHFCRSLQYAFTTVIIIGIGAVLILLDHLVFKKPLC
ncbi:hypothetical protein LQG66_11855 [Bradyrhizobium ontarionense]|uniref:Uncharacterized protein n=1 Tax=Bradyrhizobium ontarionense TaxID=2898149 RepID=A0ABY3RIN4_9BRAD|nr:hypothetical protein [Bradyrhizobium sp. A19]UFZ06947.1 hypothetical protein LQG66_11855 [Bradyrhizobium sp. A19]